MNHPILSLPVPAYRSLFTPTATTTANVHNDPSTEPIGVSSARTQRIMATISSDVKDVDIQAVWDGIQGHAVQAKICLVVASRPGACVALLERSNSLVEYAEVINVRHSSRPDALPRRWEQDHTTFHKDDTSSDEVFADLAVGKVREGRRCGSVLSTTSWDPEGRRGGETKGDETVSEKGRCSPQPALGSAMLRQHHQTPSQRRTFDARTVSPLTRSSSLSGSLAKRSGHSANDSLPRRQKLPSSLFHDEAMQDLNARLRSGLAMSGWKRSMLCTAFRKSCPTVEDAKASEHVDHVQEPSCRREAVGLARSRSAMDQRLRSRSIDESPVDEYHMLRTPASEEVSRPDRCICTMGCLADREADNTPGENETAGQAGFVALNISPSEHGLSPLLPRLLFARHTPNVQSTLSEQINHDKTVPGVTSNEVERSAQGHNNHDPGTEPSPTLMFQSSQQPSDQPYVLVDDSEMAMQAMQDSYTVDYEGGYLCLRFGHDVTPGRECEVKIEARIYLSVPDDENRQSFCIPGLLSVGIRENQTLSGRLFFNLETDVMNPNKLVLGYAADDFLHWHIGDPSYFFGRFRLDQTPMLFVCHESSVHRLADFSTSVLTCATVSSIAETEVRFDYRVTMTCDVAGTELLANRVELMFIVRHGNEVTEPYEVRSGDCKVFHKDLLLSGGKPEHGALISITRDVKHLCRPIKIGFSMSCRIDGAPVSMPTVRPFYRDIRSETIILAQPRPPLMLEDVSKNTWRAIRYIKGDQGIIRLDRLVESRIERESLEDDPLVRIVELPSVPFGNLESSGGDNTMPYSVSVARNLSLEVHKVVGGDIECRIEIDIEAGRASNLLTIDPLGWDPSFSLIDGHLATEKVGEWRRMKNGYLGLYQSHSIRVGQIVHVTFCFLRRPKAGSSMDDAEFLHDPHELSSADIITLPKIVEKTILGGVVRSGLNDRIVFFSDGVRNSTLSQKFSEYGQSQVYLPILTPNYRILFVHHDTLNTHLLQNSLVLDKPHPQIHNTDISSCDTEVVTPLGCLNDSVRSSDAVVSKPVTGDQNRPTDVKKVKISHAFSIVDAPDEAFPAIILSKDAISRSRPAREAPSSLSISWDCTLAAIYLASLCLLLYLAILDEAISTSSSIAVKVADPTYTTALVSEKLRTFAVPKTGYPTPTVSDQSTLSLSAIDGSYESLGDTGVATDGISISTIGRSDTNLAYSGESQSDGSLRDRIDHALGWRG